MYIILNKNNQCLTTDLLNNYNINIKDFINKFNVYRFPKLFANNISKTINDILLDYLPYNFNICYEFISNNKYLILINNKTLYDLYIKDNMSINDINNIVNCLKDYINIEYDNLLYFYNNKILDCVNFLKLCCHDNFYIVNI